MAIQKTEGFILKTYDFRETSKIVFFYTKEFGKIKGILKGIREDRKKFSTTLDLATLNEIIFYQSRNKDLHLISKCDLIKDFPFIRKDVKRMVISFALLELTDNLTPPEEKNISIFELLRASLDLLDRGLDTEKIWISFQIKVMKLAGFKPELENCLVCGKEVNSNTYFSLNYGGLLCLGCREKDKNAKRLLKGTLASLLYIDREDFKKLYSFNLTRRIKDELQELLRRFIEYHSEIRIKSERLLSVLR